MLLSAAEIAEEEAKKKKVSPYRKRAKDKTEEERVSRNEKQNLLNKKKTEKRLFDAITAATLKKTLQSKGIYETLSEDEKAFITSYCYEPKKKMLGSYRNNVLYQLFGIKPQVGATVTLEEAFKNTLKGMESMNSQIVRWKKRGIIVSCTTDNDNLQNTVYTLVSLGDAEK